MIQVFALLLSLTLFGLQASDEQVLKVTGIGKVTVKADIADVKVGIEVEGKTALAVQRQLSERLPALLDSLQSKKVEKLETGVMEIYPEYSNSNPPEIKSYRGRIDINFSSSVEAAGELIGKAMEAGANNLSQVTVRPSEAVLDEARLSSLKNACSNAVTQAETVMEALGLIKDQVVSVSVPSFEIPSPIFRNPQPMMMAMKNTVATKVLEGEQVVHSQVNLNIKFHEK